VRKRFRFLPGKVLNAYRALKGAPLARARKLVKKFKVGPESTDQQVFHFLTGLAAPLAAEIEAGKDHPLAEYLSGALDATGDYIFNSVWCTDPSGDPPWDTTDLGWNRDGEVRGVRLWCSGYEDCACGCGPTAQAAFDDALATLKKRGWPTEHIRAAARSQFPATRAPKHLKGYVYNVGVLIGWNCPYQVPRR
jgi:hypothetical protein